MPTRANKKIPSYQHQADCLREAVEHLEMAQKDLDKKLKPAKKGLKKAEDVPIARMEWLAVADKHGHETASLYLEQDDLS